MRAVRPGLGAASGECLATSGPGGLLARRQTGVNLRPGKMGGGGEGRSPGADGAQREEFVSSWGEKFCFFTGGRTARDQCGWGRSPSRSRDSVAWGRSQRGRGLLPGRGDT